MNWMIVAQLIVQYGLPLAVGIVQKWEAGTPPSSADLTSLALAASQTAKDRMLLALKAQNIDPTSAQGVALLAAVSST